MVSMEELDRTCGFPVEGHRIAMDAAAVKSQEEKTEPPEKDSGRPKVFAADAASLPDSTL